MSLIIYPIYREHSHECFIAADYDVPLVVPLLTGVSYSKCCRLVSLWLLLYLRRNYSVVNLIYLLQLFLPFHFRCWNCLKVPRLLHQLTCSSFFLDPPNPMFLGFVSIFLVDLPPIPSPWLFPQSQYLLHLSAP